MLVVDASPLIHLARVSLLELLRDNDPTGEIVVPMVVFDEVMRGANRDPTASLIEQATHDWLVIVPTPPPHASLHPFKIDLGEIAVLTVALSIPGAVVALDDLAARGEASRLGIPRTGTLRLLIDSKARGLIPSVQSPLDHLKAMGMRLSEAVYHEVLKQAGEP